jgi:hypothetical protein
MQAGHAPKQAGHGTHPPVADVASHPERKLLQQPPKAVGQGQIGDEAVVGGDLEPRVVQQLPRAGHPRHEGPVGQLHALGRACGAAADIWNRGGGGGGMPPPRGGGGGAGAVFWPGGGGGGGGLHVVPAMALRAQILVYT